MVHQCPIVRLPIVNALHVVKVRVNDVTGTMHTDNCENGRDKCEQVEILKAAVRDCRAQ